MSAERPNFTKTALLEKPTPIADSYHQSVREMDGMPQTASVPSQELHGNIPNIFSAVVEEGTSLPVLWQQDLQVEAILKDAYGAKADIGGSGGHVEVADPVEATFADFVLRFNYHEHRGNRRDPIFRSLIFTHTGDDVAVVGVVDRDVMEEKPELIDEVVFEAFWRAGEKANELGQYGPWQDLKSDAFTGNIHGLGPARINLPLPLHPENSSQVVLVATGDKTEPALFSHVAASAYYNPAKNTGLLIADSALSQGYVFEFVDLNTKQLAIEMGVDPNDQKALDAKMNELGKQERVLVLSNPEDHFDIGRMFLDTSRYVPARIYSKRPDGKPDQLGYIISAERLHNIEIPGKGHVYAGKDDPIMLALAQGNWPAPGEIVSHFANSPVVSGDCRGSHGLEVWPAPIGSQTSFWSGPIVSAITLSINTHTGRIGSVSDQFGKNTPWDQFRLEAAAKMREFRNAQSFLMPGTLGPGEMEYQTGYTKAMARLASRWDTRQIK